MCRSRHGGCWSRLSLVVWLSAALFLASPVAQAQDSSLDLTTLSPLWETLLPLVGDLPQAIDNYSLTWQQQVKELQALNESLTASNLLLQTSNETLTRDVGDLRTLLQDSQADLATSEAERKRLEKSLSDSMESITQAQGEAKKLAGVNTLLTVGCVTLGITTLSFLVYTISTLVH